MINIEEILSELLGMIDAEEVLFLLASIGILLLPLLIFLLVAIVVILIGRWKLFVKAGKSGWQAIIPFYNSYVLLTEICGLHWAFSAVFIAASVLSIKGLLLTLIRVGIHCLAMYNLTLKFHKDPIVATICSIFVADIVFAVYGYSKNHIYDTSVETSKISFFSKI